ncbi:hypothetical protein MKX07_007549 [Trichoderma sp. CBMAI-0711]|nr:hypothetical protein MKX07_007549 [Trichoderma sp. CBMAI-0711]
MQGTSPSTSTLTLSAVLSGFGSTLPQRGHSADRASRSSVAVATAVVVTVTAMTVVCGSSGDDDDAGQRKKKKPLPADDAGSMGFWL